MRRIFVSVFLFFIASTAAQAANCFNTFIQEPRPFLGNGGEILVLTDGSVWRNNSYLYLYLYAYSPMVTICPDIGKMALDNTVFEVARVQ